VTWSDIQSLVFQIWKQKQRRLVKRSVV
jgi:hypothetical protein